MKEEQEQKFIDDLKGEDMLGIVVRGHIHVESQLEHLLETLVPYPQYLKELNLDYAGKVHVAVAMGLRPEYAAPLKTLGSIRNRFAHRLDTDLSKNDTENLYKVLHPDDKNIVQQTYERIKTQLAPNKDKRFKDLIPKEQFILLVVTLRAMLLAAVSEAKR
jgi:hypothetical protein